MFKRIGRALGDMAHTGLRVVLILIVVLAAIGAFQNNVSSDSVWNRISVPGILMMLAGAALSCSAGVLSKKLADEKQGPAEAIFRLVGVLICGVGAVISLCL